MSLSKVVSIRFEGDLAWVTIDNPPVNATSNAVRAELLDAIQEVQSARVAILACAGKTFVAGGDMSEFDAAPVAPDLPDVVQAIEDSSVPFIAALHGNVLGGGLELALGCTWRIASAETRFGLPEVNVGLVPGAGGTQRLPRLVGLPLAIQMAASGRIVDARTFLAEGGLDHIAIDDLAEAVTEFAANLPPRPPKVSGRPTVSVNETEIKKWRETLTKRAKGQSSPLHNLDALMWSSLPFEQGQPKERALHLALRNSDESRALRHVFFAERAVSKPTIIANGHARKTDRIVVVGGGLMGTGIATSALFSGASVTLIEREETAAKSAVKHVYSNIDGAAKRGKISQADCETQKNRLSATTNYEAAAEHDLAIEAVFEDVEVKQNVFRELAAAMAPDAILATNTSYLDPTQIFAGIPHTQRCVGLHFFSPAHIMKLLEVVHLPETSANTLATSFALAKRLRKTAVLSGICDGFIGNRMLAAYRRASEYMLADGCLPHEIDSAMRNFGMAMGPFEAQDMSGLQIAQANRRRQDQTRGPSERYVEISDRLCDLDRLGQKSGKGWYRYESGSRTALPDPEVSALIENYSREIGIVRSPLESEEIQIQLVSVLANEGARIIEEGIAESDSAADIVKIHGYGFPRWRGGPMHAAAAAGEEVIRKSLERVEAASPGSWIRAERYK